MNCEWLPLTEYSSKYRVSISTLRRRIKEEAIQYKFEDGKYFIGDEPISAHQKVHRPSPNKSEDGLVSAISTKNTVMEKAPFFGLKLDFEEDTNKKQGLQNFNSPLNETQNRSNTFEKQSSLNLKKNEEQNKYTQKNNINKEFINPLSEQSLKVKQDYNIHQTIQDYENYETYQAPVNNFLKQQTLDLKTQGSYLATSNVNNQTINQHGRYQKQGNFAVSNSKNDAPILNEANKLLGELKKAYTLVLQEKEEQILKLRQENADLKTYVKALESENERLVRNKNQNDLWILG